jgi:excisionase family DNA binding protein
MNRNGSLENARDVLSVRDVQQILGIGRNATYELISSGRLASVRVTRRRIVVTRRALEAFLVSRRIPPANNDERLHHARAIRRHLVPARRITSQRQRQAQAAPRDRSVSESRRAASVATSAARS